jgi:hypothetical protein
MVENGKNARGLFPRPLGESEFAWRGPQSIGEEHCAICGTYFPEDDEKFNSDSPLERIELPHTLRNSGIGISVITECCGKLIDNLYLDLGARFTEQRLEEFAANPGDPRFEHFRRFLSRVLKEASENAHKVQEEVTSASSSLD